MTDYKLKITEDGSYTLHSPLYGEDCHSLYGAKSETEIYYLKGCQVLNKLTQQKTINILEVGFGIGLGLRTTYEKTAHLKLPVHFLSLEIDEKLIQFVIDQNLLTEFSISRQENVLEIRKDYFTAKVLIGNARETLPLFPSNPFDAIFQDAFSPKKNSILWTVEWFRLLKEKASPKVIMSTYSASSSIRKSMMEAGWAVFNGPNFSGKKSSTVANLSEKSEEQIIDHLKKSPVPIIWDETHEEFAKM